MTEPWDSIIREVEKVPTPKKITIGGHPEMRIGGDPMRIGVYTRHFEDLIRAFEKAKV
jgi:hypothetical protein